MKKSEQREAVLRFVGQRPGITIDRLAVLLNGLSRKVISGLLTELEKAGEIHLDRSPLFERPPIYLKEHPIPKRQLFQPAKNAEQLKCKTSTGDEPMPSEQETETDKNGSEAETPSSPPQRQRRRRSPQETRDAVEAALAELVKAGKPFKQADVLQRASVSNNYLNTYPDMRTKINDAIERIRIDATVEQPQEEEMLRAEVERLQQENAALKAALQTRPAEPRELPPIEWLRKEEERWQEALQRVEQEREAIVLNLHACQRMLSLHEAKGLEFVMVVPNRNGAAKQMNKEANRGI